MQVQANGVFTGPMIMLLNILLLYYENTTDTV
jgi:hypothetical protein